MSDYNNHKVPELKKLLADRNLPISGNKADLIARLQEDDKKPTKATAATSAPTAEDEIDWDEDDAKATTASAAAAIAASGQGPVANPVIVPNQKLDEDPAKTSDLKIAGGKETAVAVDSIKAPAEASTTELAKSPAIEAPKQNFTLGIGQTDAEKEAEKRAARAKRFGLTEDVEEKRKLERAKKFGAGGAEIVKGLDEALPERKAKRGRKGDEQEGRAAKRQTPDRRTEGAQAKAAASKGSAAKAPATKAAPAPTKKVTGRITDDPVEKAKAEARAKRFQTTA